MIYKITKDTESIEAAAEYLQTSAEDSKSFLYIGDNMETNSVTLTIDSAIKAVSIFAYGEKRNIQSVSVSNTVGEVEGATQIFDETDGIRQVYKSDEQMTYAQEGFRIYTDVWLAESALMSINLKTYLRPIYFVKKMSVVG